MQQGLRIAVIGESVLLEGIGLTLEDDPAVTVARTGVDHDVALKFIDNFRPHVIVYELGSPDMAQVMLYARLSCCVRLVVLDDNCNQVLVMDSRLLESPTMADLQEYITYPALECPEENPSADLQEEDRLDPELSP